MPGQHIQGKFGGSRAVEKPTPVVHPAVFAGAAFALGLVTGLFLKGAGKQTYDRARRGLWHREYKRTVTYDENLPDSLARREPAPDAGEPRYGGTGALGVSPESVVTSRPEEG